MRMIGNMQVEVFTHPQGCRGYLLADPASKEALALDVHLDLVHAMAERVKAEGWEVLYVVDTHTHADYPSGAGAFAARFNAVRIAHEKAHHAGVTVHPKDGEKLRLGKLEVTVRHAPGHTPDHMVLTADGAFFSGDGFGGRGRPLCGGRRSRERDRRADRCRIRGRAHSRITPYPGRSGRRARR